MPLEWLIPAILVVLGLWIALTHVRLSGMRRAAIATWDPLEMLLRQRHDLVAPLIQLVLAHLPKQKKLTDTLLQARNAALGADLSPDATGRAELHLATAMQRVLDLERTHPELGAELTFRRIRASFEELDAEIALAGEAFNEAALCYNRAAVSIPAILVVKYAGLHLLEYFAVLAEEREALRQASLSRAP
ncbi:MAG: LemA family protein [Roseococcus sp.]|nr:LemA family protein [Roseococcus sp.]